MPMTSPNCGYCRSTDKMDRLSRRTYTADDKTGKQKPWGWVCPDCGAVRVDKAITEITSKKPIHWIYKGIYS